MPWFKVDDKLHGHAKTRMAGTEAMGLWVLAGSWSADHLKDGFVPEVVAVQWDPSGELAARLVAAKFWRPAKRKGEPGWLFNNWMEMQPTRAKVEAAREAARKRMSEARESKKRSRDVRPNISEHSRSSSEVREKFANPDPTRPPFLTEGEGREPCDLCLGRGVVLPEGSNTASDCPKCKPHLRIVEAS